VTFRTSAGSVASGELTGTQRARRDRVIRAALQLAAEGGYDAVLMRDVSARADVALGTIYRYFSSKDHLLVWAMADWTGQLRQRLNHRPPQGDGAGAQVMDVLRRACRSLDRQPQLAAALIKAMSSADSGVGDARHEVDEHLRMMLEPILGDIDAETRMGVIAVIGHVWNSSLIAWTNGSYDMHMVVDELERAVGLLLPARHTPPRLRG
jgi:AcrR family transcriptional regulator